MTEQSNLPFSRRRFIAAAAAAPAIVKAAPSQRAALLGGSPIRTEPFPGWPVRGEVEDAAMAEVVRSGGWGRGTGHAVSTFESKYSAAIGARHCLATSSGTSALFTALAAIDVGPGDEVIVPPYTFIACVNVILTRHAIPVFADTDPNTFQVDAASIQAKITAQTAAIMPVHLGGSTFDVDAVLAIAHKRNIPVVEDSCQSHFAEWRGKRTGAFGTAGCFSFQASKNLNSGEGGALLTNDPAFIEQCYTFHNNGRGRTQPGYDFSYRHTGFNVRMTEFQAAMLLAQMTRLEKQMQTREQNAKYLGGMLKEIGGLTPVSMYGGCTRNAYHLYMMRYQPEQFAGLSRAKFLKALIAEGVPVSEGYAPLNKEPFLRNTFATRGYQRIYGAKFFNDWSERNHCPGNDRVCEEAVWLIQTQLLGPRRDMDQIAEAVAKVKRCAGDLARG
jgi:perosamine synthetase